MTSQNVFIFVDPQTKEPLHLQEDKLASSTNSYPVIDGRLPNLIYPFTLSKTETDSKNFYEGRAQQYDETLHLTFFTHSQNEQEIRNSFIDRLSISADSKVLEIACGTGRDSVLIAKRLSGEGELHVQDISEDMMNRCIEKLDQMPLKRSYCLSNAGFLPYPDQYFDAVYSFGAMGEFADKRQAIKEMARVTKPGGKIVFGDECVPSWYRNTEFYKILLKTNPMFAAEVPFAELPVESRDVKVQWVIGGTFYLLDFEVGVGEPEANFDFEIPGLRGGTYRTRYEGELEGVTMETKKLAWEHIRKTGTNMHTWLDEIVRKAVRE